MLLLSLAILPGVFGQSIGVSPSKLEINLHRGQKAKTYFRIINPSNYQVSYYIQGDWFEFSEPKGVIKSKQTKEIEAIVSTDAPNGEYIKFITVSFDNPDKKGVSFNTGISIKSKIKISGKQLINLLVEKINVNDAEQNNLLIFGIQLYNKGNVKVKPDIYFLLQKNNITIDEFRFETDYILPNSRQQIRINRSTDKLFLGSHTAKVQVSLDKPIKYQELVFNVYPLGYFSKEGRIKDMQIIQNKEKIQINSIVKNTGKVPLKARFQGKLNRNNQPLDIIESDLLLLAPSQEKYLTLNYEVPSSGKYHLVGSILYNGESSNIINKQFIVKKSNKIMGFLISFFIVVTGVIVFYRKQILSIIQLIF
ncbi:MAG: hypothetical protein MAG795_00710 [Candidatus Woesearchaeota archaeon]|nr:hypothetical protein [Candidatus Woesearchaeota archaeon]